MLAAVDYARMQHFSTQVPEPPKNTFTNLLSKIRQTVAPGAPEFSVPKPTPEEKVKQEPMSPDLNLLSAYTPPPQDEERVEEAKAGHVEVEERGMGLPPSGQTDKGQRRRFVVEILKAQVKAGLLTEEGYFRQLESQLSLIHI